MARIGVVLPAYNAGRYLAPAVASVLGQTFRDLRLFVIDDGSKDGSVEALSRIADPRLEIVSHAANRGLVASLNEGLALAAGCEYIARMDADDLCLPERFARQADFLARHPDVGLVGSAYRLFGEVAFERTWRDPQAHEVLAAALAAKNPFSHPSVMLRASALGDSRYDPAFPKYEDYALWIDLSARCRLANLPEVLLKYRRHGANITGTYRADPAGDVDTYARILARYGERRGLRFDAEEVHVLSVLTSFTRAARLAPVDVRRALDVADGVAARVAPDRAARRFLADFLLGCALAYAGRNGQLGRYAAALAKRGPWRLAAAASIQLRGA